MYKYASIDDFWETVPMEGAYHMHPDDLVRIVWNAARETDVPIRSIPPISDASYKTFHAISDPKNAHLFTLEAALKAFSHVKADTDE